MLYGRVYKLCCTGRCMNYAVRAIFVFFVWFFVIFVTFQGGFRHWDPFQTNPCAKSYKMNVSRASGTPCGSSYGHFCFFIKFLKKSVLGGPTSKKITFFSFCARALCAGLVRMSCAPSCAPKANLSIEHRSFVFIAHAKNSSNFCAKCNRSHRWH